MTRPTDQAPAAPGETLERAGAAAVEREPAAVAGQAATKRPLAEELDDEVPF